MNATATTCCVFPKTTKEWPQTAAAVRPRVASLLSLCMYDMCEFRRRHYSPSLQKGSKNKYKQHKISFFLHFVASFPLRSKSTLRFSFAPIWRTIETTKRRDNKLQSQIFEMPYRSRHEGNKCCFHSDNQYVFRLSRLSALRVRGDALGTQKCS